MWEPRPGTQGVFERGIVNSTMTILTRDMKGALDYFFPDEDYPDFAERAIGQIVKLEFPCLAIGPRDNTPEDSEDLSHVVEDPTIDIHLGVKGDSAADVTNKIMGYAQVADSVLRNAKNDFFTGMSSPFGLWLQIRHDYSPIGGPSQDSTYFRAVILRLTVHLNER